MCIKINFKYISTTTYLTMIIVFENNSIIGIIKLLDKGKLDVTPKFKLNKPSKFASFGSVRKNTGSDYVMNIQIFKAIF